MNKKAIEITFPNGDLYELDLMIVANNRADEYADTEAERKEEIEYVMNDKYEGVDWLKNNMNYEDVKDKLVLKKQGKIDTSDFCNFEMEIKSK